MVVSKDSNQLPWTNFPLESYVTMVKDMCKECGGVSPERCCVRRDGPRRHQFSLLSPPKEQRPTSETTPPVRSDVPTQVPARNPWGPVLQNRSNFLEMHLC